jgi:signal transduction histidine kinase
MGNAQEEGSLREASGASIWRATHQFLLEPKRREDSVTTTSSNSPALRTDPLGRRILKWSLLIALVPMLLLAGQGYHCARSAVLDATVDRLSQLAASQRTRLQLWLTERLSDAAFLARCPVVRSECVSDGPAAAGSKATDDFLKVFIASYGTYEAVAVYDLSWQQLAGAGTDVHGLADFALSGIKESVSSSPEPAIGKIHRHPDHSLGIHFGAAVLGAGGRPAGYVLTALDCEPSLEHILREGIGPTSPRRCYLVSDDGTFLTEPDGRGGGVAFSRRIATDGFQRGAGGELGAAIYTDYLGREVVGGFAAIPEMGWILLIEQDATEALSWLSRLAWRAGITALVVALGVVLLAFRAAKRMTAPLQQLVAVANQVASGVHSARADSVAEPEVDALGKALNHMLDELASARQRLVHNATLAAMGEMSSAVVHEMRNPLSSIKLNLQALHSKLGNEPKYGELARIAQEQVGRLERMLTDLLSLGSPLTMHVRPMELRDAIAAAMEAVADEARKRHCRMRFQDGAPGAQAQLDPERIRQALVNLLQNALEAIAEDGEVVVRTSLQGPPAGRVILEILDDGPGIPEDNLDRLFQPFFTTRSNGTGLGLSIVRKIVEYHGGFVSAANRTSHPGGFGGAVFRIDLPQEQGP